MTYLLDANVFIEAKNRYYGFDVCPGFWTWLDDAQAAGTVRSVEKIRDELLAGADELAAWVKARAALFLATDNGTIRSLATVATWARTQDPPYDRGAQTTFLQVGDSYLVAHAHAYGLMVVTHEVRSTSRRRIKIPDVCAGLEIPYIDTFEMLRREGASFA